MITSEKVEKSGEIIPHLSDQDARRVLRSNDWNLDHSINESLDNDSNDNSNSVGLPQSPEILSPTSAHADNIPMGSSSENLSQVNPNTPTLLEASFLCPPRFRLTLNYFNETYTDFSILFNRSQDTLGMVIERVKSNEHVNEISIRDLSGNDSLAKSAGLRIGDIITGVEKTRFSQITELQDVLGTLKQVDSPFIRLHFRRFRNRNNLYDSASNLCRAAGDESAALERSSYHKLAQSLLEQGVISEQRAQKVTESIKLLKKRVLQWESGTLAERVRKLREEDSKETFSRPNSRRLSGSDRDRRSILGRPLKRPSVEEDAMHATLMVPMSEEVDDIDADILPLVESHAEGSSPGRNGSSGAKYTTGAEGRVVRATNKNIFTDDMADAYSTPIFIDTKDLRPALAVRVVRADVLDTHVVYVIWVMDVKSGAQWTVRRRFREFSEFRDALVSIRRSIGGLDFPSKVTYTSSTSALHIADRTKQLQKFLRKTCSLICVNSLHSSTHAVQRTLQKFLDVDMKMPAILILESENENLGINNNFQTFVHSVMQMGVLDRIYDGFLDHFVSSAGLAPSDDGDPKMSAMKLLDSLRLFMNSLQGVVFDGLLEEGKSIVMQCKKTVQKKWSEVSPLSSVQKGFAKFSVSGDVADEVDGSLSAAPAGPEGSEIQASICKTLNLNDDEVVELVRCAVRRQVEIEIYIPCREHLRMILENAFKNEQVKIEENLQELYYKEQSFYGLSTTTISVSNWEKAVDMFSKLRQHSLPQDRLNYLIACAKEIPKIYAEEHSYIDHLGADEFLPIFIYVLVQARTPNLLAINAEMQALVDPEKKVGEAGYYLATLEAAIEHISDLTSFTGRTRGASAFRGLSGEEQIEAIAKSGISFDQDTDSSAEEGSDDSDEDTDMDEG